MIENIVGNVGEEIIFAIIVILVWSNIMEVKRIEGLWDCKYCGQRGIKARFNACRSCGKPRGIENTFYLPDNIEEAELTKEEASKTTNEPDWLCDYCGSYNSSNKSVCEKCGANISESKRNYGTIHKLTGKLFGRRNQEE